MRYQVRVPLAPWFGLQVFAIYGFMEKLPIALVLIKVFLIF